MSEEMQPQTSGNGLRYAILAVAAVYVLVSLYLIVEARQRVDRLEQRATAAEAAQSDLEKRLAGTATKLSSDLKANSTALTSQLGSKISARAAALEKEQQASEARLSESQKAGLSAVSGEVAGVKTDVGGVKSDVATTRADLEATRRKLETAIGDLGVQSGLIAHTRDDLEVLKHKGDRNYYEFSLSKAKKPSPVGTVSLQLTKVDQKRGKYTLNVMADDRTIEKKDRNVNEPVQFYSGRDRQLFELVVFTVAKDKVTGYLSTPKGAPAPTEVAR